MASIDHARYNCSARITRGYKLPARDVIHAVAQRGHEERQDASIVFARGIYEGQPTDLELRPEESPLLAEMIARQATIAIRDAEADERLDDLWRRRLHARALLCIPLLGKDEPIGFLFFIDQRAPRLWRADEVSWAESFATHAALALEKAYLYSQVERVATLEERQPIAAERSRSIRLAGRGKSASG